LPVKKIIRALLLLVFVIISIPFAIFLFIQSKFPRKPRPVRPVTEEEIGKAEKRLGFGLPPDLRAFFLGPEPRTPRRCVELYRLKSAVDEYRMVTKAPYGPNGLDWPPDLFPFADLLPGFALYVLSSGTVVIWDPEDLGEDDDSPELWDKSFTRTSMTLGQWLATPD
jgi:hypothetical protein